MKTPKVLIVVDVQKGFIDETNSELINKINSLMVDYDKIFIVQFSNSKKSLYYKKLKWKKLISKESQEIAVNIPSNSTILKKDTYALKQDDIEKIKALNVDNVDICGLKTDACIYAISLQLFDNGIYPNILINYTYSHFDKGILKPILEQQFGKFDDRK